MYEPDHEPMDQPPPPILPSLPDVVSSTDIPPPSGYNMAGCFQKQQVTSIGPRTEWYFPTTSSSSSSTTAFSDYQPALCLQPPPPPSPPVFAGQASQPNQLSVKVIADILHDEFDEVVLTNSVCLLFVYSIDNARGLESCQAISASDVIMKCLYYILTREPSEGDNPISCYATGILTNISKFEDGRAAILGLNDEQQQFPSQGVKSLIRSLQSGDINVVIFAITAIHNLLLDRRNQENAKEQIKYGLQYIVKLLNNQSPKRDYEFKVIVLDCLQILAYGNRENRLAIKESGGPDLLLRTIRENFCNQSSEELVETASRVLKSLSTCPENKRDIIDNGGIEVLTDCIRRSNQDILKTCLWTLRSLSDVINKSKRDDSICIRQLVQRLLEILNEYPFEPSVITCALGILANLTCNNEPIKQFISGSGGIYLLLQTIANTLGRGEVDNEILEPTVCALCNLMNQTNKDYVEAAKRNIMDPQYQLFEGFRNHIHMMSEDLKKAFAKLRSLTFRSE